MARGTEDLLVRIDATTEQLRRELKRADDDVGRSAGRMDRRLSRVNRSFDKLNSVAARATRTLGAFGVALGAGALARFAEHQIEATDAIAKAAQTAGIGTDALQELRFAFSQLAGTTDREVDEAIRRFNRRIGEARNGSKEYGDALTTLNVSLRDSSGHLRDTEAVLNDAINRLTQIEDSSRRAQVAAKLFGENAGPKLAGALGKGSQAVNTLRQDAHELNLVIDKELIRSASDANDRFAKMSRIIDAKFTRAVVDNAGAFVDLAEALGKIAVEGAKAASWLSNLGTSLGESLARLQGFSTIEDKIAGLQERIEAQMITRQHVASTFGENSPRTQQLDAEIKKLQGLKAAQERLIDFQPPPTASGGGPFRTAPIGVTAAAGGGDDDDAASTFDPEAGFRAAVEEARFKKFMEMPAENAEELNDALKDVQANTQQIRQAGQDIGFAFSSAFEDAVIGAQGFRSVLQGVVQDLQRIALRTLVTQPLGNLFSSAVSGAFGAASAAGGFNPQFYPLPASADGNVFARPGVTSIAERGIPEAVLPLTRIGGQLGVKSAGNGHTEVNAPITIDARGADRQSATEIARVAQQIPDMVTRTIVSDMNRDGPISKVLRK